MGWLPTYDRVSRWVSMPRAPLAIAALAFALSLPALAIGFAADDYDLALAVADSPVGAYVFQPRDPVQRTAALLSARDAGMVAWWADPGARHAFLRPLASLSLALDFHLWRSTPWPMHLENSALFALIVLYAWRGRRVTPFVPPPVGESVAIPAAAAM